MTNKYTYNRIKQTVSFTFTTMINILSTGIESELDLIDDYNVFNSNQNKYVKQQENLGRSAVMKELSTRNDIKEIFISVDKFSRWDIGYITNDDVKVIVEIKVRDKSKSFFERYSPFIEKDKADYLLGISRLGIKTHYTCITSDNKIMTWNINDQYLNSKEVLEGFEVWNPVKRKNEVTRKYELNISECI